MSTISGAITTFTVQSLIFYSRIAAGIFLFFTISVGIFKFGIKKTQSYALYLYVSLLAYGVLISIVMDSFSIGSVNLVRDIIVGLLGVLIVSGTMPSERFRTLLIRLYSCYGILVLLITILLGGLSISFPPTFHLEYIASSLGAAEENTYSLGISNFFGFSAVATALFARNEDRKLFVLTGSILAFIFLSLSMLGGGRGESFTALALVLLLIPRTISLIAVALSIFFYGILSEGNIFTSLQGDFLFIRRFILLLEGNLSSRDILLSQGFSLLSESPQCIFVGCGLGYFQNYFEYDFGSYPHNVVVELLISYGLPIVLVGFILSLAGAFIHYRNTGRIDLIIIFFVYSLVISLKSGYLMGSWMFLAFICYFSALSLEIIVARGCRRNI